MLHFWHKKKNNILNLQCTSVLKRAGQTDNSLFLLLVWNPNTNIYLLVNIYLLIKLSFFLTRWWNEDKRDKI